MRMNRALVLEAPVDAPDGAGGRSRTWSALGTLWADVQAGAVKDGVVALKVRVRAAAVGAPSRPVTGQRFRVGERVFPILGVTEEDRILTCHAEGVL
ncbi:head-tail adaptor protein [Falsirhodobacter sp. 20TX0035]|uniref:head-tail adaptor protein n=1 Tax=Falsirhodobacter sp. 20TX0035 TaxID=3022019 RepID=UPI00232BCEAE|nr:head-tail adaptor protein [Falsirhodobacter sp. 20TX0035]MDB6453236.1 head-tail adaptor protein [Falsirhodobacter sp. 20TX0035]